MIQFKTKKNKAFFLKTECSFSCFLLMKNLERKIINALIKKGGLYGEVANLNKNDSVKSRQFIFDCYEQLKNKTAQKFFGKKLVAQIKYYCENTTGFKS